MKKNKYKVMDINAPVFAECPIVYAKSASDAVFKVFNVKAKRSGAFTLNYCVIHDSGRKTYLKNI